MNQTFVELKDIITITISLIALIIPIIIFFTNPSNQISSQTYIVFIGIILFILIGAFSTYIYSRWKQINIDIKNNKKAIKEIDKSLNLNNLFNKMDVRLKILEAMRIENKKGQLRIDPRIIYWILLIILIILFLKSVNFF